ncbi:MAG: GTPase EngC2 [candidate division WWE3 bacterium GW2011_GWA1_46_21]|uniref:GTPase EngC2 n=4 Tax=Katanobacteria TaxID=422282 RepID=A0A0G1PD73_UNCKA|nr:MAG: GTPase EngC2 [candidate division WWE3 bacterium GW2011_GWA1_46_21]KKU49244.1 MAG: GTPase EngC2 [candidate division WWE3 bacterium GW2011_GWA2_46_9]KKU50615.1 MAG: hypothetical protein UX73_C0019G0009 [candidate division WWE3 bacterium GW2011_GWC1_47_10]KKU57336.1 MAG: GTPase EngC2 [candidate division WWE3 bacterium GW2011_GWB1_47_11]
MTLEAFLCRNCGKTVPHAAWGTKNRNHCPGCLYSLHVDDKVGDRLSACNGLMEPMGKIVKPNGEEVLVHKCLKCSEVRKNRIAGDDSVADVAALETMHFL